MNDMKSVKNWFFQYKDAKAEADLIQEKINHLREEQTSLAVTLDGLPKSTVKRTMADYAAKIDDLCRQLETAQAAALCAYETTESVIAQLDNSKYREVLTRRYLSLQSWGRIAEEMYYTRRRVFQLHEEALKNFCV